MKKAVSLLLVLIIISVATMAGTFDAHAMPNCKTINGQSCAGVLTKTQKCSGAGGQVNICTCQNTPANPDTWICSNTDRAINEDTRETLSF